MNATMEAKFKPIEPPAAKDLSAAPVSDPNAMVKDSTDKDKTSFKDLLLNSNDEAMRSRAAQKNGDELRMAKTDAEFARMMADKANQGALRKPQNELDKDAFLKLFVTQMRNQDPLSPDNSSQMAAQLAQFHGLEQMMNVNKNLEKMQADEALGRAVGLISFVGKDIRLDNGKLMLQGGKVQTDASLKLEHDAVKTTLEVRDSAGALVAQRDLGALTAGEHKVEWDGKDHEGKAVTDGAYTFSVVATDVQGQAVTPKITSTVQVTGVDLHDQGGAFYTHLGKIRINEVAAVGDAGFSKAVKKGAEGEKRPAGAADAATPAKGGEEPLKTVPAAAESPGVEPVKAPAAPAGATGRPQVPPAHGPVEPALHGLTSPMAPEPLLPHGE